VTHEIASNIRDVLRDHAHLPVDIDQLDDRADLFAAGMGSHASISVMLALEDTFDIEFPDSMLKRAVFESVGAIADAVARLQQESRDQR
jgi:acyl carrier protein